MNYLSIRDVQFVTCPGSPLKEEFHGQIQSDGRIKLVSDGFRNIQDYISSFEAEADIHNIIERVNCGELDLLTRAQGSYIDTIGMPKTYAEVLNLVNDGMRVFDSLPVEVREKFNNDFNTWFAQMDDDGFYEKSGFIRKVEQEVKEEVKSEE